MTTIFITGSAGFIGSNLSEYLLKENHEVIGIDNFNDFYDPELKRKNVKSTQKVASECKGSYQLYEGDIRDPDKIDDIFKKHNIDVIVHLAAMAGVRPSIQKPYLYEDVNCTGTLVLLEKSKEYNMKNFILGSSSSVYGLNKKVPFSEDDLVNLPYSPYAQTKRANELQAQVYHQLYDINFACLRFFTVYGPRQRPDLAIRKFTQKIYNGEPIQIYGDGSYQRDFTYVDDIIDGIVKSISWISDGKKKFDIFNLGESDTTSVNELIDLIEKASGKEVIRDYQDAVAGDVPITYADISKSKEVLGYNPQTKIEEGIKKFINWFESLNS